MIKLQARPILRLAWSAQAADQPERRPPPRARHTPGRRTSWAGKFLERTRLRLRVNPALVPQVGSPSRRNTITEDGKRLSSIEGG